MDDGQKVIRIAHLEPLALGDLKKALYTYNRDIVTSDVNIKSVDCTVCIR